MRCNGDFNAANNREGTNRLGIMDGFGLRQDISVSLIAMACIVTSAVAAAEGAIAKSAAKARPAVTLSSTAPAQTNLSPIPVTVTIDQSVIGFTQGDLGPVNATIENFRASFAVYRFDLVPSANGTVSVSIPADAFTNAALESNTASTPLTRIFDTEAPTAVLSSTAPELVDSEILVNVALSEPSTTFTAADITATNATVDNFAGSGAAYSFSLIPGVDGLFTATINAAVFTDAANNANAVSDLFFRTFGNVGPTITLSSNAPSFTSASPLAVSISISESNTGFGVDDIVLENATLANFTGAGLNFDFDLIPSSNGIVTARVPAARFLDLQGSQNTASNVLTRTFDTVSPTALLSSSTPPTTTVSPIPITLTLSETSSGFSFTDIDLVNATLENFVATNLIYTFDLVPVADGLVSAVIPADRFTDLAGNASLASNLLSFEFDGTAPTVLLESSAPPATNVSPIPLTVTISEFPVGFETTDISLVNATLGSVKAIGQVYSFYLSPISNGTVSASVLQGQFTDVVGNPNEASNLFSRRFDTVRPSASLSSATPDLSNLSPIPVTVNFDEGPVNFVASDILLVNATLQNLVITGLAANFNLVPVANGIVSASIPANRFEDAAGNTNTASNVLTRTFDNTVPTVNLATAVPPATNTSPIAVTMTVSESPVGLTAGDITLSNASIQNFVASGLVFTFDLVPNANGAVSASLTAGRFSDAAGNLNAASNVLSRTFDNVPPSVILASSTPDPVSGAIAVNAIFGEPSANFTAGDVSATRATVSGFSGSGTGFSFTLTPTAQGTFSATINAGAFTDGANNPNIASNVIARVNDSVSPTIALSSVSADPVTGAITVDVALSEANTTFVSVDVTVLNATLSNFAGGGTGFSFTLTPNAAGVFSAAVAAGRFNDAALNPNSASNILRRTFAPSAPILRVSSTSLSFGPVVVGEIVRKTLLVANAGSGVLVGSASVAVPFAIISGGDFELEPGERQSVVLEFAPETEGESTGALVVTGGLGAAVSLDGTGVLRVSSIRGNVSDFASGEPVPCATIVAYDVDTIASITSSDSLGEYLLRDLVPGDYDIAVFSPGYEAVVAPFFLDGVPEYELDFELEPAPEGSVAIVGQVTDVESGDPLGGTHVRAFDGGELVGETFACAAGAYELTDILGDGKVTASIVLEFSGDDYATLETEVVLTSGVPAIENVVLVSAITRATVTGTVTGDDALPLEGVEVFLNESTGFATSAFTDGEGNYTISNAPPAATLYVRVSAPGFLPIEDYISLEEGITTKDYLLQAGGEGEGEGEGCHPDAGVTDGPAPRTADVLLVSVTVLVFMVARRNAIRR